MELFLDPDDPVVQLPRVGEAVAVLVQAVQDLAHLLRRRQLGLRGGVGDLLQGPREVVDQAAGGRGGRGAERVGARITPMTTKREQIYSTVTAIFPNRTISE